MNKKPLLIDIPEYIETQRLILRMPQAGWGKRVHEAVVDGYEDCVKNLNWPANPPMLEMVEEDCRRHHAQFILRDDMRYLITLKESDIVVGRCAFPAALAIWEIPQFGISYFIRRSYQNRGYAREAAIALTEVAFYTLHAQKVEITVDAANIASRKVAEGAGFTLEYQKQGGWPRPDGKLATLLTFAKFKDNYIDEP